MKAMRRSDRFIPVDFEVQEIRYWIISHTTHRGVPTVPVLPVFDERDEPMNPFSDFIPCRNTPTQRTVISIPEPRGSNNLNTLRRTPYLAMIWKFIVNLVA